MSFINLSNEQINIAYSKENGCTIIKGAAGSGKTLVGIERTIYLATNYPYASKDDKILFLYYNKSLEREIVSKFEDHPNYAKVKNKIKISNIDKYIVDFLKNNTNFINYLSEKKMENLNGLFVSSNKINDNLKKVRIENILKEIDSKHFKIEDVPFLLDEINWLRQVVSKNEYSEEKFIRSGRGSKPRLTFENRKEIISILKKYREIHESFDNIKENTEYFNKKFIDFYDFFSSFLYFNKEKKFFLNKDCINHIIVDEAQDLSRLHFEFLKLLCPIGLNNSNTITLILDAAQSIYPVQAYLYKNIRTIGKLELKPLKKAKELGVNYRNIKEIFLEAKKLLEDEKDNEDQNPTLYDTQEKGLKPFYIEYESLEEELEETYNKIQMFVKDYNYNYGDITVIAPSIMREAITFFRDKNLLVARNNKILSHSNMSEENPEKNAKDYINISTFQSAKGTENKIIFILSLNNDIFEKINKQNDKTVEENFMENKKLLYVGMTRSKEILLMSSYHGKAKEMEVFDFKNFVLAKTDDDFKLIFNNEIHYSKNINNQNSRYLNISEVKKEEEKISNDVREFRKRLKEKAKNEIILNEIKEKKVYEVNYEDIEESINDRFPTANQSSIHTLINAEYSFKKITDKEINNEKLDFSNYINGYIISCETELRILYNFIVLNILKENNDAKITLGELITFFDKQKIKYPELYQLIKLINEKKLVKIRNKFQHRDEVIFKLSFDEVLNLRNFILDTLFKKILNISEKIKNKANLNKEIIEGIIETDYNKINGLYAIVINGEILALSKNYYPKNKNYKFVGNYKIIKGEKYFIIEKIEK